jgi:hypothetical protein
LYSILDTQLAIPGGDAAFIAQWRLDSPRPILGLHLSASHQVVIAGKLSRQQDSSNDVSIDESTAKKAACDSATLATLLAVDR